MTARDWTATARQLCLEIHSANPAPHAVEHVRKLLEAAYAAGQADKEAGMRVEWGKRLAAIEEYAGDDEPVGEVVPLTKEQQEWMRAWLERFHDSDSG